MQGSHCMADRACCCPLQLIRMPGRSDGPSESHLLLATVKQPAGPWASLPACLCHGCLQCAGDVSSALWVPAKTACQHIMVACGSSWLLLCTTLSGCLQRLLISIVVSSMPSCCLQRSFISV